MDPVDYEAPEIPVLLTISVFLYAVNVSDYVLEYFINAGLLGPLVVGIVFGPQAANIIPEDVQRTFISLGYIGLILLVFEAGLTTDVALFFSNLLLSTVVALSGIIVPIALSLLLLHVGYGYTLLQAFAAGAALCSTSLATTLALLRPELRQSRVGSVLLSAALLDDIVGLVIAGIITNLSSSDSDGNGGGIYWPVLVRPILVSVAFALGTPLFACRIKVLVSKFPEQARRRLYAGHVQLFIAVSTLAGFVAGARYSGTSDIFGAYLAGAFLAHAFPPLSSTPLCGKMNSFATPHDAFATYLLPMLQFLLSPVFFASIGIALPIRSLFTVDGSHRVVWRGLIYSLLMITAKAVVGVRMLIWPKSFPGGQSQRDKSQHNGQETGDGRPVQGIDDRTADSESPNRPSEPPPARSAALLGLAMVARGEIALIVAQLARPLLAKETANLESEPFAVVIWAVLLTTIGGALGVGLLLRSWK